MRNRSFAGNYSQFDEAGFQRIDRILDAAEAAMLAVASERQLREINIERWRWDKPEILMSWVPFRQFPSVGKNIRVLVKPETTNAFQCSFESNAWFDDRKSPDSFTRYWDHFLVGTISIVEPLTTLADELRHVHDYVEKAYEKVADAKEVRLDHAILILSNGESFPVNEALIISSNSIRHLVATTPE